MLIHSHCTLSRENWSNSPDWPSGRRREWPTFGTAGMRPSNSHRDWPGKCGRVVLAGNAKPSKRFARVSGQARVLKKRAKFSIGFREERLANRLDCSAKCLAFGKNHADA